jgi:Flp pilus assembly protein TadD
MQEPAGPGLSDEAAEHEGEAGQAGAREELRRALAEHGRDPRPFARLGQAMTQSGDLAGAEQAFQKAAELDPAGYRPKLAQAWARLGRRDDAVALLQQCLADSRAAPQAHFVLGQLLQQSSDLAGAEQEFRRAAELDPGVPAFRNNLAGVLSLRGLHAEAARLLEPAVAEGSADAATLSVFGKFLQLAGDPAGAEQAFRKAADLDPGSHRASLAEFLSRQGKRAEAVELLRQTTQEGGADAHTYFFFGQLLQQSSEWGEAERAYSKAVELDPGKLSYRNNLAGVLTQRGRNPEALALLEPVIAEGCKDAATYVLFAKVLERLEDLEGAERAFHKAIELEPTPTYRTELAEFLNRNDRADEAYDIVYDIATKPGADAYSYHRVGRQLLFTFQDKKAAETALQTAMALDPGDIETRISFAEVVFARKRYLEVLCILGELGAKRQESRRASDMWNYSVAFLGNIVGAEMRLTKALRANPHDSGLRAALAEILRDQRRSAEAVIVLAEAPESPPPRPGPAGRRPNSARGLLGRRRSPPIGGGRRTSRNERRLWNGIAWAILAAMALALAILVAVIEWQV